MKKTTKKTRFFFKFSDALDNTLEKTEEKFYYQGENVYRVTNIIKGSDSPFSGGSSPAMARGTQIHAEYEEKPELWKKIYEKIGLDIGFGAWVMEKRFFGGDDFIKFTGQPDAFTIIGDTLFLVDHKTGKKYPTHIKQGYIYSNALFHIYPSIKKIEFYVNYHDLEEIEHTTITPQVALEKTEEMLELFKKNLNVEKLNENLELFYIRRLELEEELKKINEKITDYEMHLVVDGCSYEGNKGFLKIRRPHTRTTFKIPQFVKDKLKLENPDWLVKTEVSGSFSYHPYREKAE